MAGHRSTSAGRVARRSKTLFLVSLASQGKSPLITEHVVLYFSIDGIPAEPVTLGLFGKVCPKTVRNFVEIARRDPGVSGEKGYAGSTIKKIVPFFKIIGGDYDGNGGKSIYGDSFQNEDTSVRNRIYSLGMQTREPGKNQAEWYISLDELRHLDGKSVVFGCVVSGFATIDQIAHVRRNRYDRPILEVKIERTEHEAGFEPYVHQWQ